MTAEGLRTRLRLPRLTDRLALGRSGLRVSPCCLGLVCEPDTIAAAYQAGINFFFLTADMHWPYYAATRQGLQDLLASNPAAREDIVVAAASYVTQPEFCQAPFEEVVAVVPELGRIDLGVIGGSYPNDFFVRLAVYDRQRPAGMRAIGVTYHHRQSAVLALNRELVDIAFIRYNSAHPGAAADVMPHLSPDRSSMLFVFNATAGYVRPERLAELEVSTDGWRPAITDHYRYALARPEVDGILCALERPEHVTALAAALAEGPLSKAEADYLETLSGLEGSAQPPTAG